jgi:hypothetical protein
VKCASSVSKPAVAWPVPNSRRGVAAVLFVADDLRVDRLGARRAGEGDGGGGEMTAAGEVGLVLFDRCHDGLLPHGRT